MIVDMDERKKERKIKSVAIIGAGASGAVTASAFAAEKYFDRIRVFERRETPGGTWIYDANPTVFKVPTPGALPPDVDPAIPIPNLNHGSGEPKSTKPDTQERYSQTPVYENLTTNVPQIAMAFSDTPFPTPSPEAQPFVPHHIPRQYIENYFSIHGTDQFLSLNTTVEDVSKISRSSTTNGDSEEWRLTLRKYDSVRDVDEWWEERFDAVVIANGHYSVPFIPKVSGLPEYITTFPGVIQHSKPFRTGHQYTNKRVLVIGNSASGHDVTTILLSHAKLPVYQSRRTASRWDGPTPPKGIEWKPIITSYISKATSDHPAGRIIFEDGTFLDGIDHVIYSTGYKPSFPFWNTKNNKGGRPFYDYENNYVSGNYLHTFLPDHPTLAIIGIPRVLTFRSFEYQAIAVSRIWAGRSKVWGTAFEPNISREEMREWETQRLERVKREGKKFHDVEWESGETWGWLGRLFEFAGLGTLGGEGRLPPVLGERVRWAIENVRKYPEPGKVDRDDDDDGDDGDAGEGGGNGDGNVDGKGANKVEEQEEGNGWVVVRRGDGEGTLRRKKDLLSFI